ncbi:MAG: hypothetical protein H7240_01405 [Glaciimonas sp.]|nr:hypothetical protein [Glaciimonas sp.]
MAKTNFQYEKRQKELEKKKKKEEKLKKKSEKCAVSHDGTSDGTEATGDQAIEICGEASVAGASPTPLRGST